MEEEHTVEPEQPEVEVNLGAVDQRDSDSLSLGEPPSSPTSTTQLEETNGEVLTSITQLVPYDASDKSGKNEPDGAFSTMFHFGIGAFHPKPLQFFASTKFFTFMLCVFGVTEGALISGFESVVLSTLERRYRFSSTAASLIIVVFDIAVTVSVIVISYFGEKAHKPRWMGIAFIVQGIGAFVFALPHFVFGQYDASSSMGSNGSSFESCNDPSTSVVDCDAGNTGAYILFILGNTIIGIAAAPLFTVGVSFIDDIVQPKYVSLHIGAFQVSTIAGPAIGFGLGSAFLKLYVDVEVSTNLTEADPAWVGSWWLSFVLVAIVSVLFSIPFFFFPRALPDTHLVTEARQKQMKGSYKGKFGDEETFWQQLKAFPFHLLSLFKSKSWLFMTIGIAVLFLSLEGMVTFAAKYIESVYRIPPSTSGLIVGAMGIVAGSLGTATGAGISHCVKIGKNLGIVNWVVVSAAIFPLFGFLLACPNIDVVGVGTQYTNNSINSPQDVLLASCNADCNCTSTIFEPVCGADGLTYFSPCRASCNKIGNASDLMFENCGCVANNLYNTKMQNGDIGLSNFGSVLDNSTATRGSCSSSCQLLGPFVVLVTIFIFLIFLIRVPFLLITIRSVADEQRSFALGVQSLMFRIFGSIPGPLLFGVLIDSGCVYAQYECGRLANCWVYDNNLLSVRAYIFSTIGVVACIVCTVLAWIFYPPVGIKRAPPDELEKESESKEKQTEVEVTVEKGIVVPNPVFEQEDN